MTIDRELVASKMARVRDYLRHLDRLQQIDLPTFLASSLELHATERELQIAIEACLDIGHHVIAREGLSRPSDYREVFKILTDAGVVPKDLGPRLETMASFRNRLVHGYGDLDPGQVYAIARNDLVDIEAFLAAIVRRFSLASS